MTARPCSARQLVLGPKSQVKKISTYVTHGRDRVLASKPDTLDIDALGQVPDTLLSVDCVVVPVVRFEPSFGSARQTHAGCMIPALLNYCQSNGKRIMSPSHLMTSADCRR